MGDHEPPDGTFFPSEDREISDGNWVTTGSSGANSYNTNTPLVIISDGGDVVPLSLWGPPAPFSGTLLQGAPHETPAGADNYSYILNDLSTGFVEAPPLLRHVDPVAIFPCSGEIPLHDLAPDMGQSSGTPTKQDSHNSLEMQTQDQIHEDGAAKQVCRQHKRKHSGEAYNLSTRLRRQKFNGKMKALQELIPKCDKLDRIRVDVQQDSYLRDDCNYPNMKEFFVIIFNFISRMTRDKESIVDDAIKYIKNLQHQVQYLQAQRNESSSSSSGAGFPMSLYPWMMPSASQTGMQIPTINLPQFRHNFPRMEYAMGMGMGMGMGMPYPNISQLGLYNPCNNPLASSSTSSGLMHVPGPCGLISESAHQDNSNITPNINPGNTNIIAFETWPGTSNVPSFESGRFAAAQGGSTQNATPDL